MLVGIKQNFFWEGGYYLACKQVTRLFCEAVAYLLLFCYSTSKYLSEPTHELVNLFDMVLLSFILSEISKQKSKT